MFLQDKEEFAQQGKDLRVMFLQDKEEFAQQRH